MLIPIGTPAAKAIVERFKIPGTGAMLLFLFATAALATAQEAMKPCPSAPGLYVQSGDGWKPLESTHPVKLKPGKIAYTKSGIVAIFAQPESPVRVDSRTPTFCAVKVAKSVEDLTLLQVKITGKERKAIVAKIKTWKGSYGSHPRYFDDSQFVHIVVKTDSAGVFRFLPEGRLPAGEFVVITSMPEEIPRSYKNAWDPYLITGYDFGYFAR